MIALAGLQRIELIAVLACGVLAATVFELVRRGKIKEKYSLLWFLTVASLSILSLKREWLHSLASSFGIYYPPSALFLALIFFVIFILIHFSMVLTKLMNQNQKLAQRVALLEVEVLREQNKAR
ncbi:MAG: DUF2304 domain-containing protein [Bdellovibrionota bacterium]